MIKWVIHTKITSISLLLNPVEKPHVIRSSNVDIVHTKEMCKAMSCLDEIIIFSELFLANLPLFSSVALICHCT